MLSVREQAIQKTQYSTTTKHNITSSNTKSCFKLNIFWFNNHINFVIGLLCHWNNIRRLRRRGNSRHKTSTQISKWSTPGMHNSYSCCWHMNTAHSLSGEHAELGVHLSQTSIYYRLVSPWLPLHMSCIHPFLPERDSLWIMFFLRQ